MTSVSSSLLIRSTKLTNCPLVSRLYRCCYCCALKDDFSRKWGCSHNLSSKNEDQRNKNPERSRNWQLLQHKSFNNFSSERTEESWKHSSDAHNQSTSKYRGKVSNLLLWAGPGAGFDAAVFPPLHPKVCWLPIVQNVQFLLLQTFFNEKLEWASIDPMMYWSFLVYDDKQENDLRHRNKIKNNTAIMNFKLNHTGETKTFVNGIILIVPLSSFLNGSTYLFEETAGRLL
jgi:hypothetical protein